MRTAAREWLPAGALTGDPVRSAIAEAVEGWGSAWFASVRLRVAGLDEGIGSRIAEDEAMRSHGERLLVSLPAASAAKLVIRALDARSGQEAATERDRALLDDFERRMFGNLALRIELALGASIGAADAPRDVPDGRAADAITVRIADGKGEVASLSIPRAPVIRFRKSRVAADGRLRARLPGMLNAVSPIRLNVEARLGKAELPLADLRGLAPGDVLILDHALSEPVDIILAGSARPFARARLDEGDGAMALTIEA